MIYLPFNTIININLFIALNYNWLCLETRQTSFVIDWWVIYQIGIIIKLKRIKTSEYFVWLVSEQLCKIMSVIKEIHKFEESQTLQFVTAV